MEGYNYSIAVGSIFWRLATRYKVEKFIIHPRYNWEDGMMGCDIALVKTAKPIQQIRQGKKYLINGICLQTKMYQEPKGDELTVAGWGKLAYASDLSNILKAVKLNIINDVECASRYENISHIQGDTFGYTVYRSQICTWSKGKDACEVILNATFVNNLVIYYINLYLNTSVFHYPCIFLRPNLVNLQN